jgi:hypothetical protein
MKIFSQDSCCPTIGSDWAYPKYKSRFDGWASSFLTSYNQIISYKLYFCSGLIIILTGMKHMLIDVSPIKVKSLSSIPYIIVSLQGCSNTNTDQFFLSAFIYYYQN